jgi:predicted RNA-binding Zn-ribbon protein involved in translation (DUF1610 family)
MAIELYCDGAVIDDTTEEKRGVCRSCDQVTDREVRSAGETTWSFECDQCGEGLPRRH